MESLVSKDPLSRFQAPEKSIGDLDAQSAASLIFAAADIALVVDDEGVIRDLAVSNIDLSQENYADWVGQPWIDTVTVESRPKIEELLRGGQANPDVRGRQVNHPSSTGADVPVRYSTVHVGDEGRVVAVGRDLRTMATLQQRLVDAQQSMEREYARLRHAETRYRLLFQIASEAVLIVDAASLKIVEVNPSASQLIGKPRAKTAGESLFRLFDPESEQPLQLLLAQVRASGRGNDIKARLAGNDQSFDVSASLFRQENASHFLIRMANESGSAQAAPGARSQLLDVVEQLPDGFVVTDLDHHILTANAAFLDLAQLASSEHAQGELLERWLGRTSVDVNVLFANLREHGSVRNFSTIVQGEYGITEEVEVSAVSVPDGEQPCLGFAVRHVGRRQSTGIGEGQALPRSVEQLTKLVGRVPLKDLVRESTDMIERLCIEAALELTDDNRASAAEMLGLSRQSLYVKLRRYGLGDLDNDTDC